MRLTFVFTDIEGSTRLLEQVGAGYADVLATHGRLIGEAVAIAGGELVDTQGDSFFLVFRSADGAVAFAAAAQRALARQRWPADSTLRVRMGIHAGEATANAGGYVGLDVHRAARISSAAHGGQVLLSPEAARALANGAVLKDLGSHGLKDFSEPISLHQLLLDGLPEDFPPPRVFEEPDQPPAPGDPPYQGLTHFEEADAARFFGREKIVERLVARLGEQPFLAVIGASGSGKSSVVRAGLIPALRAKGVSRVVLLTPTAEPLSALDDALAGDELGPASLLVVDQAEELFSLCRDEDERAAFIERVLAATSAGGKVVLTLRADFYDRLAGYPALRDLVAARQEYLGPMSPAELRAAITGPAQAGGWRFDAGLVELILHDVGTEPGALPLLSHALLETWQRRRGRLMMLRGYLESGGVQAAIARSADRLMAELQPGQQDIARTIFLRLTEFGAGTPDTRRRAALDELVGRADGSGAADVLQRLAEHRLVVLGEDTAEVAHEALIREWPTLREWLAADREALRLHRGLTEAAGEWQRANREPSLLYRGARLAGALDWVPEHTTQLNDVERDFLDQSRLASEREASRQLAGWAQLNLDIDPELSMLLAIEAAEATRRHDGSVLREAQEALHKALARSRIRLSVRDVESGVVSFGVGLAPDASRFVMPVADKDAASVRDGRTGVELVRLSGHAGAVQGVQYSPDGSLIATVGDDGTLRLWDAESGADVRAIQAHEGGVFSTRFRQDGRQLVTLGADQTARVWDVASGRLVHELPDIFSRAPGDLAIAAQGLAFAPGGLLLVGRGIEAQDGTAARVFDLSSGEQIMAIEEPSFPTADIDVTPDGRLLAAGDAFGYLSLWMLPGGEAFYSTKAHEGNLYDLEFSPDGTLLATASADGTAKVWGVRNDHLEYLLTLPGHNAVVVSVSFSRDGTRLLTGSLDGRVRLWDVSLVGCGEVATLPGHDSKTHGVVAFTPDGDRLLASSGPEGTVRVWKTDTWEQLLELDDHSRVASPHRAVVGLDVSPDGSLIATAGQDGTARIVDAASGETLHVLAGDRGPETAALEHVDHLPAGVAFNPDGARVATTGVDETVRIYETETGRLLRVLRGHANRTYPVGWSPDGERILAMAQDGTRIWEADTGRLLRTLPETGGPGVTAAWSPDGMQVLIEGGSGPTVWDAWSGDEPIRELTIGNANLGLAFSSDGSRLAIGSIDGTIRIWDWPAATEVLRLPQAPGTTRFAFSRDGMLLAAVAPAAVRVFALDHDLLLQIARDRVTRSLTDDECRQYLQRPCAAALSGAMTEGGSQ